MAFLPLQASKYSNFKISSITKQFSTTNIQIFSFSKEKCSSVWSYDKNISTFWQKCTFTKGLLAAAVAATAAASKKMSDQGPKSPKSPKYEPPDIHPELTLAQIQQQLSEQLSGQCPIAKHRKKHNSNNVKIHEDIDGGIWQREKNIAELFLI